MKKIVLILAILIPASLRAQLPAWSDSSGPTSAGCYRLAVTPLTEAPPIRSDMSLSTLLGYIYLDSLMRTPLSDSQWASFESIQSFDSLSQILKYLYAIIQYDPVLFGEYCRDAPYINSGYSGPPAGTINSVEEKIGNVLSTTGDTSHMMYLTTASYILHIKVTSVFRSWDTMANPALPQSCIEAVILDTVKGQHILTGGCEWDDGTKGQTHRGQVDSSLPNTCIHFSYNAAWSKTGSDVVNFVRLPGADSAFFPNGAIGWNAMVPDSEYIVFFGTVYEDYDGTDSYFDIRPLMGGGGVYPLGIYPVVGSIVSDPTSFWRMGTSVPLSQFESRLKEVIYNIENP